MQYAMIKNNKIEQIATINSMFPNTSFHETGPNSDFMAANGIMEVIDYIPVDVSKQRLVYVEPYIKDNKVYVCMLEDLSEQEKQNYQNQLILSQWDIVRQMRDQKLKDTDYTQLSDVNISNKQDYVVYRQQLRDITTQTDPYNIVWPTKP